uniref:BPTI/Kunitz inhibitor domain-containing protein n=1 Tax=Trichobilharzia regenti TaxID=157069 RepID=A0AA85JZM6_TRIRE|nr:unnamed protein product [Trichobilharzia regenti]
MFIKSLGALLIISSVLKCSLSKNSVCFQQKEEGPCRALVSRYHYNFTLRSCVHFYYGGCGGNQNNFPTEKECQKACGESLLFSLMFHEEKQISQNCDHFVMLLVSNKQWKTGTICESFQRINISCYLLTLHQCLYFSDLSNASICFLEKDPGTCRGYFSRYFYNKETKLCEIFKYGGCLGNQNNFKSLEECQTTCSALLDPTLDGNTKTETTTFATTTRTTTKATGSNTEAPKSPGWPARIFLNALGLRNALSSGWKNFKNRFG